MSRSLVQQLRDENAFLREQLRTLQGELLTRRETPAPALAPQRPVPQPPRKPTPEDTLIERAIASRALDGVTEKANRQFAQTMRARGWKPDQIADAIERGAVPASRLEDDLGMVVR